MILKFLKGLIVKLALFQLLSQNTNQNNKLSFVQVACLLALLSHHCLSTEKTFASSLCMQMFFAVMITNILFAVNAYTSPKLMKQPYDCGAVAVFFHYFALVQFTTMLSQVRTHDMNSGYLLPMPYCLPYARSLSSIS